MSSGSSCFASMYERTALGCKVTPNERCQDDEKGTERSAGGSSGMTVCQPRRSAARQMRVCGNPGVPGRSEPSTMAVHSSRFRTQPAVSRAAAVLRPPSRISLPSLPPWSLPRPSAPAPAPALPVSSPRTSLPPRRFCVLRRFRPGPRACVIMGASGASSAARRPGSSGCPPAQGSVPRGADGPRPAGRAATGRGGAMSKGGRRLWSKAVRA